MPVIQTLTRVMRRLEMLPSQSSHNMWRTMLLSLSVGLMVGLVAIFFHIFIQTLASLILGGVAGYHPHAGTSEKNIFEHLFGRLNHTFRPELLIFLPALGGFISGWLTLKFAPEAKGHGTDSAIDAFHNKRGMISGRVPIIKLFASTFTMSSGGSGGSEGPIAQIGAGFGSVLATKLKLSDQERRVMLASGMGAGIGAIFQTPLAGAIFASEVLYRDADFEAENVIPAFVATTMGYCIYNLGLEFVYGLAGIDSHAFFNLFQLAGDLRFDNPLLLLPLTGLALVMSILSYIFVKTFYGIEYVFDKLKLHVLLKPVLGGLLTGILGYAAFRYVSSWQAVQSGPYSQAPEQVLNIYSTGYGILQTLFNDPGGHTLLIPVLILIGIGKILATSLTIGSGSSGGIFGPSMIIGGCFGAVFGLIMKSWLPGLEINITVFALLGMACFFAAAANTPLSSLIIVSEMTAGYALLLPNMWVCAIAYLLSRGWTMFNKQLPSRLDSPAHRGDFVIDILKEITVKAAMPEDALNHKTDFNSENDEHKPSFVFAYLDTPLSEISKLITNSRQTTFPVLDHEDRYYGAFTLHDIRQFLYDSGGLADLAVAHDLARTDIQPLTPEMTLSDAISRFTRQTYEELPVAHDDDPKHIIGLLQRYHLIATYNSRLLEIRSEEKWT